MLRVARYALAAISITLTLAGCQDAAAPLSTVDRVPVAFVTVEPPTAIALAGQTVQLTATTKDADGKLLTDRVVTWASGNTAVATVSSGGLVTGVAVGRATITATSEAKSALAAIEVVPPGPIPDIDGVWDWTEHIDFSANQIACDDTGSYTFTQQGAAFVGVSEQVGTCAGPGGKFAYNATSAVRAGVVTSRTISFRAGTGQSNSIFGCQDYAGAFGSSSTDSLTGTIACGSAAAASGTWRAVRGGDLGLVRVTPSVARVLAGGRAQFQVELWTVPGHRAFGRPVTWSTDNAAVATVTPDGIAAAAGSGTTTVTATVGGASGSASLTVAPPLVLTRVAAGVDHTCALEASGQAYCWGVNGYGQLGTGDGPTTYSPAPVSISGGLTLTAISAGFWHTCGLATNGAAYCWGQNDNGELGNGSTTGSAVPVPVTGGLTLVTVSTARLHTCGLSASGAAYCWGWNGLGQLGDGATTDRSTPVPVSGGLTFVALSAGGHHTCGVTASGAAYCWGNNANGELGIGSGSPDYSANPVPVAGGLTFTAVSAGYYYTCGVATGGAAYCWGWNGFGQLGNGSTIGSAMPVPVAGALTVAELSAGFFHTCGLTTNGAVNCWGRNVVGELGNGSTNSSTTPVAVAGGLTFVSVSADGYFFYDELDDLITDHTCGITTNRVAYCWGDDSAGQLGTGGYTSSSVPVKVAGQP